MNSAEWFNKLEVVLESEAIHAGLLEHGTMIGVIREFIVQRVLRSFLPPIVHFGTGKITDSNGSDSKQVDVVLFDGRFPHFSSHGVQGIYPVEGVLATLEIKSDLTREKVAEAFENCLSVSSRVPHTVFRQDLNGLKEDYKRKGLNPDDAFERQIRDVLVPTFIFSFRGPKSAGALAKSIAAWVEARSASRQNIKTVNLPRLIVAGNLVAVLNDGVFNIGRKGISPDLKTLYLIAETPHRFGWLATHLISSVCGRLHSPLPPTTGSAINNYLPIDSFLPELTQSENIDAVEINRKCSQPVEGFFDDDKPKVQ